MDHEQRLRLADKRCQQVLSCTLAQSDDVLSAGQQLVVHIDRLEFRQASAGRDAVTAAATTARVFTLKKEAIHYSKVIDSLQAQNSDPRYDGILDGLLERWDLMPRHRSTTYVRNDDGTGLPPAGVTDAKIADRVLYSELVHADDAAAILDHLHDDQKQWALTAMVVDWICLVAQTQHLMRLIRPDLVPQVTPWTGDSLSLFERWGVGWVDVAAAT